jgi:transcriptional regulator with XRE-family HTH domain
MTEDTGYPLAKAIGAALKKKMAEEGWTQEALAIELNMGAGTLSDLLNGVSRRESTIRRNGERVCAKLGCSFEDIIKQAKYGAVHGLESSYHCIEIGENLTLWYRYAGNGISPISPADISLQFDRSLGETLHLSPRVEQLVRRVLHERDQGRHTFENNPLLTIFGGKAFPPIGIDERDGVELKLGATDYAICYALRRTEEGQRYFRALVNDWTPEDPFDPIIAQGLGVNVAIVSNDEQMIFGRRFENAGARPQELDVGAVEGFALKDFDAAGQAEVPDVMVRGVSEEYGISTEQITDIKVLGFGYDLQWAQWNFLGLAWVDVPAQKIRRRHKGLAAHGLEYIDTIAVPATPKEVFEGLSREPKGVWSCGLATAYYALVHLHGADAVEKAADRFRFTLSK